MAKLDRCFNATDFRQAAKARLPRALFDYIAGGADDETALTQNTLAFSDYSLAPRYLRQIDNIRLNRQVLGCDLDWPLILAPTGMNRMFHAGGELAVAVEAERSGVGYSLSTMATESIENIARACPGPKIYQLYLLTDDSLNFASIDRCKAAGFDALCLTVDTVVAGNRERDLRNGLTVPPKLTVESLFGFATRPGWCYDYLRGGKFSLPNVPSDDRGDLSTLAAFFASKMERNISWAKVERIAKHWNGPFALKGIQTAADARLAASAGATAVIISNHGGRQLDGGDATIRLVEEISDAVGDRIEIILDGGIRRGSHIVKALALGADACMTGRPYLFGLSAFGQPGVRRVLELLREETERTMALIGCANVADLDRSYLRKAGGYPAGDYQ